MVGPPGTDLLVLAVDVGEESDTGAGPDINLPGEGGDPGVEPVVIEGSKLLSCITSTITFAGLDEVNPAGPLKFIILLQEVSVSLDELGGRDVLDGEEFLFDVAEHLVVLI